FLFYSLGLQAQFAFHILEAPVDTLACDSTCTMLHGIFPKSLKTNTYTIGTIPYAPQSITGTPVVLGDDQFSNAIPIGFNFCFFENVYTQCYISDNGILTFNSAFAGASCNNNTQQLLPYFNSTFPDNAIFFLFMDVDPTLGGNVSYATIGSAPNRKLVIRYQNMKIFGATCTSNTSSYQVILYETTNVIEVHAGSKTTCDANPSNYSNYATIGIQNTGATQAFTAPGKHASVFTMTNEALRISPSGPLNYLLTWKDANNNTLATNTDSLYFCPPSLPYSKIKANIQYYCPPQSITDSVVLVKLNPHIDSLVIIKPQCNGDSTGSITVVASSPNPPLTYSLNNGPFGTGNSFIHLPIGNYLIKVKDANGCVKDTLVFLTAAYNVFAYIDSIIKPTCPDSNGKIVIHAGNGLPPYSILWSTGDTTWTLSGLPAGNYVATVTDANGCSNYAIINLLYDSLPVLQVQMTKPQCHDSSGMILVNTSGGTSPYHYLWNTGDTTASISNLPAGQYIVTVTDVHGCSTNSLYFLTDTLNLAFHDTVLHHTSCNLPNGQAMVNAGLGLPPYTFLWMPGGQNTAVATGLAAGIYTFTVTDANNCVVSDTVEVYSSTGLIQQISKANANCDSSNGKIYLNGVLNATGATHTLWSTGDTTLFITGLAPGIYWVQTTDSIGCIKKDTLIIGDDGTPYLGLLSYTAPLCYGDSTGSITLSGTSGTAPYKYSVDGVNFSSVAQISHIAGGSYTIYITDANSCPNDTVIFFPQPLELISTYTTDTVICYNDPTSFLHFSSSGGFPPYSYSLNGAAFVSSPQFPQLTQGVYTLVLRDSNLCMDTLLAVVPGPANTLEAVI
ncbi:MAG TPA: SprB repeat-containing protein, partial [Chitinophagaceae bacterium]|nr:SprB repeat-containing protein [Chitinophagaceae bacterium]